MLHFRLGVFGGRPDLDPPLARINPTYKPHQISVLGEQNLPVNDCDSGGEFWVYAPPRGRPRFDPAVEVAGLGVFRLSTEASLDFDNQPKTS